MVLHGSSFLAINISRAVLNDNEIIDVIIIAHLSTLTVGRSNQQHLKELAQLFLYLGTLSSVTHG